MSTNDALLFFLAALVAVLIAKVLIYNVASAQHWF